VRYVEKIVSLASEITLQIILVANSHKNIIKILGDVDSLVTVSYQSHQVVNCNRVDCKLIAK